MLVNNKVGLSGTVKTSPEFLCENHRKIFYRFYFSCTRTSGFCDDVPCIVTDSLVEEVQNGLKTTLSGRIKTRNVDRGGSSGLEIYVYIDSVGRYKEDDCNEIELDGYICKPPTYRKTPLGREIADLLLAVNRPCGKSDYIPCIAWGRNAKITSGFEVGSHVQVCGRMQSREYTKKLSETECEKRVAYEVSVSKIRKSEESKDERFDRS